MAAPPSPEETRRRLEEIKAKAAEARSRALAVFPFERVEVPGELALAKWEELKQSKRGIPVVIGDENAVSQLGQPFLGDYPGRRTATEILSTADKLRHPADLFALRAQDKGKSIEGLNQTIGWFRTAILRLFDQGPRIGRWPTEVEQAPGLSVARALITQKPLEKVYIALIPTDDWTTVPAHLRWGGWNANPSADYHVSALRSWRERYGIELVGMNFDTINLLAKHPPQTRAEALELAREQYAYCSDIVDQGVGTLSALAASLMADRWWFFWWD